MANAQAAALLEKKLQETASGEETHGAGDPGQSETEASFDQTHRVMNTLVSVAKVKLTSTRDRIDTCLRGIDDRKVQLAEDFANFRDELKQAENMAASIDASLDSVTKMLGQHIEPRPATVTHLRTGTRGG